MWGRSLHIGPYGNVLSMRSSYCSINAIIVRNSIALGAVEPLYHCKEHGKISRPLAENFICLGKLANVPFKRLQFFRNIAWNSGTLASITFNLLNPIVKDRWSTANLRRNQTYCGLGGRGNRIDDPEPYAWHGSEPRRKFCPVFLFVRSVQFFFS